MKIKSFNLGYGNFSRTLYYGEDSLAITFPEDREGLMFTTEPGEYLGVCLISGRTPGTYYSGNREYGKIIFSLPEGVIVKEKLYYSEDGSNAGASEENNSFLRLPAYSGGSIGYDFYRIQKNTTLSGVVVETMIKIQLSPVLESVGFYLTDNSYAKVAMPVNIPNLVPDFRGQVQGWRRNDEETHLFALVSFTSDEGDEPERIECFIPFAWSTAEYPLVEGYEVLYLRQLIAPKEQSGEE